MSRDWATRAEGGSRWVIRLYLWCVLRISRRIARLTLWPISAYFLLVRGPERRASRAYLARALGRPARLTDVLRNFWTFAQIVLDRVYLLGDRECRLNVTSQNVEVLGDALARGQGCLLVGSHLGSFEASRIISLQRPDVNLRIVLDRAVSRNANGMLESLNPALAKQVIDTSEQDGTLALRIGEALLAGDLVAITADRMADGERAIEAEFLGERAAFPLGPFLLASATKAPVVLFFGLYEGGDRYRVIFEPFEYERPARSRGRGLEQAVQAYADRLSHHARRAPYNWFNFFPFWAGDRA
ncbi:MAG: hypothetical protein AAGD86_00565 [Pseudomonadota bacterium]